jgi:hypothetical protein
MKKAGATGTASVFPFRLGRQTIRFAFLLREPLTEGHRLVPGDMSDRLVVCPGSAELATQCPMARLELLVLGIGDLEGAEVKRLRDVHLMGRRLVPVACLPALAVARRRGAGTHLQFTRFNTDQFHPQGIGQFLGRTRGNRGRGHDEQTAAQKQDLGHGGSH